MIKKMTGENRSSIHIVNKLGEHELVIDYSDGQTPSLKFVRIAELLYLKHIGIDIPTYIVTIFQSYQIFVLSTRKINNNNSMLKLQKFSEYKLCWWGGLHALSVTVYVLVPIKDTQQIDDLASYRNDANQLTLGLVSTTYINPQLGLVFLIASNICSSSKQRALKPESGWLQRQIDALFECK